jgi:hypothetical protein
VERKRLRESDSHDDLVEVLHSTMVVETSSKAYNKANHLMTEATSKASDETYFN